MRINTETTAPHNGLYMKVCLFLFGGILLGLFLTYFLKNSLYTDLLSSWQTMQNQLLTLELDSSAFCLFAAKKHIKYWALLCFFSFTNIWSCYYSCFTFYIGLKNGLLLSFCIFISGPMGVILYLCFLLPQVLLLVPGYLICLCHCQLLYAGFSKCTKKQLVLCQLPYLLVSFVIIILGCILEGYLNPPLLRFALSRLM